MNTNQDFAKELIKRYGIERFYHCSHRIAKIDLSQATFESQAAFVACIYFFLNENCLKENFEEFFDSIALPAINNPFLWTKDKLIKPQIKTYIQNNDFRIDMCRIAFGFSKFWKELGLKTHELPEHIHARMVLGEKNEWVVKYLEWLKENK